MSDMYYGFSENTDPVNNGYSQESGNNNSYGSPAEPPKKKKRVQETEAASVVQKADIDDIDFEKKLEESLKDL